MNIRNSDLRLLERMREDDARAFETIFRRHYATLCRGIASYLGDPDLVEDVVQSVLARLWYGRKTMEIPESLGAYLHAAIRRKAIDELRREEVRRRAARLLRIENGGTSETTGSAFDAEVLRRRFERALADLPPRTREAFILSRDQGMKYDQIALRMGISIKTVGVHIGNSLAALRKIVPGIVTILTDSIAR